MLYLLRERFETSELKFEADVVATTSDGAAVMDNSECYYRLFGSYVTVMHFLSQYISS